MIKIIYSAILIFIITIAQSALAQNRDAIIGKWTIGSGKGQIEVFKKANMYYGKIVQVNIPADKTGQSLKDKRNLIPALRKRALLGLVVLRNCTFNSGLYEGGTIYDPTSGKTYSCQLRLVGEYLKVQGYIGMFPVKADTWVRVH
jgi:uncharacterized protein (DUF2147 family)